MDENYNQQLTNIEENNILLTTEDNNDVQQQMNNEINEAIPITENTIENDNLEQSATNSVTNIGNENKETENQNLINENKYKIDKRILQFLKYILIAIFIKDIFVFSLSIIFICTEYYLPALFTFLGFIIPRIISSFFFNFWDQASNIKAYVLNEFVYYNKNKIQDLQKCMEPQNKELYRTALKKIEDLRYYTLVNALIHGLYQIVAQIIIICLIANGNIYILSFQSGLIIYSIILVLLCIYIYRDDFCDLRNELGIYRVNAFMFLFVPVSCILYVLDIFTDFLIFVKYCIDGHYIRATLTLTFIIVPGIYNYWRQHCITEKKTLKIRFTNILAILLNFKPVKGYYKNLKLMLNTRKAELEDDEKGQIVNYEEYIGNNFKVTISRYTECFTESCSQIIIQLSFILSTIRFSKLTYEWMNIGSNVISGLNVAVTVVLNTKSYRIYKHGEDPLPFTANLIHFIGYIPVAPRLVVLSLLASVLPYWTCLFMFVHWFCVCIWWHWYSEFEFTIPECICCAVDALQFTFIAPGASVKQEIIFHFIFIFENICSVLLWNIYNYGYITTDGILPILLIILFSVIGWICKYFFRKYFLLWIVQYKKSFEQRNFIHC